MKKKNIFDLRNFWPSQKFTLYVNSVPSTSTTKVILLIYDFVCFQHTNPEFFRSFSYAYLCHNWFIFYNLLNIIELGIYVIISFCTTIYWIFRKVNFSFKAKYYRSDILPTSLLWALFKIKEKKIAYRDLQFYFLSFLSKVFCHQIKYVILFDINLLSSLLFDWNSLIL